MYPTIEFMFLGEEILLKTYSTFMILSMTFGIILSYNSLKDKQKHPLLLLIVLCFCFLLGARLLNFLVNYQTYSNSELSLFTLKAVGFSFYGGIVFCIFLLVLLNYFESIKLWEVTDSLIVPFGISFFLMRIGCFLNGCCYGKITDFFLGVNIPRGLMCKADNIPIFSVLNLQAIRIHPTQLYEGFGALIGVIVLLMLKKRFKTSGLLTIFYGIYLTIIRWVVLYFRHFEYKTWVIYYLYPMLYLSFIIIGVVFSINRIRKSYRIDN